WEAAFFVAGIPGLILAVAALFIADPVRGGAEEGKHEASRTEDETQPGSDTASSLAPAPLAFSDVARLVLSMPTMWGIIASGVLHNFNMYALGTFLASLMKRYHQVSVGQAGEVSGLVQGFGALGIFAAGWLGDRAFQRQVSGRLHVAWIGLAAAIPCL